MATHMVLHQLAVAESVVQLDLHLDHGIQVSLKRSLKGSIRDRQRLGISWSSR